MATLPSRRSLLVLAALVLGASGLSSWWAQRAQASVGEQVAALARPGDIRMLSATTCASCTVARRWFQQHDVPFTECKIDRDAACLAEFQARLAPGTPVIIVRDRPQLGFSPERLLAALQGGRAAGG
jgi:glutaredoxin